MGSAPEAARDFLLPLPGIPTACGNGKWGSLSRPLRAAFWAQDEDHRPTGSRVPSFCSIGAILPSRPARSPCRRAQRRSRMARLRATASAARSVLDGREHDGMLDRVGAAISPCNKQTIKRRPRKTIKKELMLIDAAMTDHSPREAGDLTIPTAYVAGGNGRSRCTHSAQQLALANSRNSASNSGAEFLLHQVPAGGRRFTHLSVVATISQ